MTGGPNPKPEVATNLDGATVSGSLAGFWQSLVDLHVSPPCLDIASAYFNPGGFDLLADQLEAAQQVRVLLGAEPDVSQELGRLRPLRSRSDRERLRGQLRDHERQMATDRNLVEFTPDGDALSTSAGRLAALRAGSGPPLGNPFLHGKAFLVERTTASLPVRRTSPMPACAQR